MSVLILHKYYIGTTISSLSKAEIAILDLFRATIQADLKVQAHALKRAKQYILYSMLLVSPAQNSCNSYIEIPTNTESM